MAGAEAGVEVEIKLGLRSPEELETLLDHLPSPSYVIEQANHYFDTPDGRLSAARIMLRVREERRSDKPGVQAVAAAKRRKSRTAKARHEAEEIEHVLSPKIWQAVVEGTTNLAALDSPVVDWVRGELGELTTLAVLGVVENKRHVVHHEGFVLEVDRTGFPDGSVDAEVEVETRDIDGARAVVEAAAAAAGVALFDQNKGKHRRFRERLGH